MNVLPRPLNLAPPGLDPVDVADYLLELLLRQSATACWLDPAADGIHRITAEHRQGTVVSFQVEDGLGDAVVARLALIAGLDILAPDSRAAAAHVRQGERTADVVVAIRSCSRGLAGEVRVLEERATTVSGPGAALGEVFEPGTRVGAYRVERQLGRGGMGIVYEVEHAALGKRFAMKVLSSLVMSRDEGSARRFVREARAAARIRHPGIVDVTDFGALADGRPYLVMELLEGRSLQQILLQEGSLEPLRALRLMRGAADALRAAHGCGVIHRDLTPGNLFVLGSGDDEHVVLVDFGSALAPDPESADVPDGPPGMVIGTPHYMAPEHIRGRPTDARTDLYSLGILLFEGLSGQPPYDGTTAREIAIQHLAAPIPMVTSPRQELPPEVGELCTRLLAKDPDERPPDAGAFIAALDRITDLLHRRGWRRWLPG